MEHVFERLLPVRAKPMAIAAAVAAAVALGACSGGGSSGAPGASGGGETRDPVTELGEEELAALRSDPRVVRLDGILAGADALLFSSLRSRYTLSGGGEELHGATAEAMACSGARCTGDDGTTVTVGSLRSAPAFDVSRQAGTPGARGGFDSLTLQSGFMVTESVAGVTVTADPSIRSYGFWGEHGFAALEIGSGRLSGEVDGTAFTGDFTLARAYAAGDVSGTNPTGTGSATWRGIAEASPVGEYGRFEGTATVTIADLSRPRVGVAIAVPGHDIDEAGWADMALTDGSFSSGTAGADRLAGNFHGPGHEEAWGVFDTADYLGAFGAKRQP